MKVSSLSIINIDFENAWNFLLFSESDNNFSVMLGQFPAFRG